jgi:hypothetical protein
VDNVKTIYSGKLMPVDAEMLEVLRTWRQNRPFSSIEDWMFASPVQPGRLPVSYPGVWQCVPEGSRQNWDWDWARIHCGTATDHGSARLAQP